MVISSTHYHTLQRTATHCNALQHTTLQYCDTLKYDLQWYCSQHTATYYNALQRTATHCNTLHCNTSIYLTRFTKILSSTHCHTLQRTAHNATHYTATLRHTETWHTQTWLTMMLSSTHCHTLQSTTSHYVTLHCNILQYTATRFTIIRSCWHKNNETVTKFSKVQKCFGCFYDIFMIWTISWCVQAECELALKGSLRPVVLAVCAVFVCANC